jgi:GNAT superfamily N-acetyltransferase
VSALAVRPLAADDRGWADARLRASWGGTIMVTRGRVHDLGAAPDFVATIGGERIALATDRLAADGCELLSLDSPRKREGAGTALLAAVAGAARAAGCRRLWAISIDDNTRALRFYQRRGFRLVALHRDTVAAARLLKPSIPPLDDDDIPIRDELELELPLHSPPADVP